MLLHDFEHVHVHVHVHVMFSVSEHALNMLNMLSMLSMLNMKFHVWTLSWIWFTMWASHRWLYSLQTWNAWPRLMNSLTCWLQHLMQAMQTRSNSLGLAQQSIFRVRPVPRMVQRRSNGTFCCNCCRANWIIPVETEWNQCERWNTPSFHIHQLSNESFYLVRSQQAPAPTQAIFSLNNTK